IIGIGNWVVCVFFFCFVFFFGVDLCDGTVIPFLSFIRASATPIHGLGLVFVFVYLKSLHRFFSQPSTLGGTLCGCGFFPVAAANTRVGTCLTMENECGGEKRG